VPAVMNDPTAEELVDDLKDLLTGVPPEARSVVIKLAMGQIICRYEQLMLLAPTGAEKEQIELWIRDLRAELAAFERASGEEALE
jgi:hypothetical protein